MAIESQDRQLRYFLSIAETGSLSRAADLLDQTQSGLSKQLALLETNLGQPLFHRTGRGVELTEAGKRLYDAVRPAFQSIDRAVESTRDRVIAQGTVRLATVHTLSYYFVADVVARFVSTRPQVNLSILGRSSPEVVALVDSGKADIGFVYDAAVDSGEVRSQPLFDDDMCLIVRRDNPLSGPVDLRQLALRLVGFPSHYALRRMLHSAGLTPAFAAEAETVDAMLQLVSSGMGDCILPCRIPDTLLAEHALRKLPIASPSLRRRVVAITPAGKPMTAVVSELVGCASRVAARLEGATE